MLIYHPAYDAFHCIYRLLVITSTRASLEIAKVRILDFYMVFPSEISKMTLPRGFTKVKRKALEMKNEYRGPVSANQVFREMEQLQLTALAALLSAGLIDKKQLENGFVTRTSVDLHPEIFFQVQRAIENANDVNKFILQTLVDIDLNGSLGLKARSGLMEYRYDNA